MANITHGMNVAEVTKIGKLLGSNATEIDTKIVKAVDSLVQQLQDNWHGPDAQNFQKEWMGTHRKALLNAAAALHTMEQLAAKNASAQETTSNQV